MMHVKEYGRGKQTFFCEVPHVKSSISHFQTEFRDILCAFPDRHSHGPKPLRKKEEKIKVTHGGSGGVCPGGVTTPVGRPRRPSTTMVHRKGVRGSSIGDTAVDCRRATTTARPRRGGAGTSAGRSHHSRGAPPPAKHHHGPSEGGAEEQHRRHRRRLPEGHNHC